MKKAISCLAYTILFFAFFSCIPQNKIEYLQDPVINQNIYRLKKKPENTIKPNDELYIKVSSFDDVSFNYFGEQARSFTSGFHSELGVSLISYTVNDSGYIYFPVIGNVKIKNLTTREAAEQLQSLLSPYFDQPMVTVKFAYKKITVIGEVNIPGYHTYSKEQINLFEAIGIAGDMTVHGNRKKVYLLRAEDEIVKKVKLDLRNDNILTSEYYYLKPDDILYVSSRSSVKWGIISTPIALTLSTITTFMLILRYFD